jgi:hypothetical protein
MYMGGSLMCVGSNKSDADPNLYFILVGRNLSSWVCM